ncbi:MAG: hypothetical protein K9M07_05045 [Simkaniaceae bacterium]|nr:hypothetical protein [Simkaniaceae bacterium]
MNYKKYPILIIDPAIEHQSQGENALDHILDELSQMGFSMMTASDGEEGLQLFMQHSELSCIIFEWEAKGTTPQKMIETIRHRNHHIPIFIMTERQKLKDIPSDLLSLTNGYLWKMEDTPHFIAGRIDKAAEDYLVALLPPFFKELIKYVETYKYSWHTPGHSGGLAFLKSPVGHIFYNFFGENVFRADLSVSVPELGSLMEHTGVNGKAEEHAAKIFGSNYTYFVTNGTSTANKIVANACITDGDIVLVDRNCHKSLQHALTLTGAIPIYFIPSRNAYGIIGGIPKSEFRSETIRKKIAENPLIKDKNRPIKCAIVTNSTYDGLIYDVVAIKTLLQEMVTHLHFDEAWYGYARFHPLYCDRYAMCETHTEKHPTVYATQSTHKLLAAFSQASMIHIKDGSQPIDPSQFNEAFMMHTSTSPQYNIIASLDVAAKMMEGAFGETLIEEAIDEAIAFREKMAQISNELSVKTSDPKTHWWLPIWQPKHLSKEAKSWHLAQDHWHGYEPIDNDFMMLDPIKVTLLTPGMRLDGKMGDWGIPAPIIARYLMNHGIVDEKTGFYSFLALFSMGITKGKSSILISALFDFKDAFDANVSLSEIFPDLVEKYENAYGNMTIRDLAQQMHALLKEADIATLTHKVFSTLPSPICTPHEAFQELVNHRYEEVPIRSILNRTMAVMLVPYPPGIPVVMPGEMIDESSKSIIDYFTLLETFDTQFPGFETETHGIDVKNGKYYTKVLMSK